MSDGVLVVDDEFLIAEVLTMMLEDMGYAVCGTAATASDAVALAKTHAPRVVLMDVRLRGEPDGIEAARVIRTTVGSSIIFITGSREPETVARIEAIRPAGVLFKPIVYEQLRAAVREAIG